MLKMLSLSNQSVREDSAPGVIVGVIGNLGTGTSLSMTDDAGGRFLLFQHGATGSIYVIRGNMPLDHKINPEHWITLCEEDQNTSPPDIMHTHMKITVDPPKTFLMGFNPVSLILDIGKPEPVKPSTTIPVHAPRTRIALYSKAAAEDAGTARMHVVGLGETDVSFTCLPEEREEIQRQWPDAVVLGLVAGIGRSA